jgi:hypothetical protein
LKGILLMKCLTCFTELLGPKFGLQITSTNDHVVKEVGRHPPDSHQTQPNVSPRRPEPDQQTQTYRRAEDLQLPSPALPRFPQSPAWGSETIQMMKVDFPVQVLSMTGSCLTRSEIVSIFALFSPKTRGRSPTWRGFKPSTVACHVFFRSMPVACH